MDGYKLLMPPSVLGLDISSRYHVSEAAVSFDSNFVTLEKESHINLQTHTCVCRIMAANLDVC